MPEHKLCVPCLFGLEGPLGNELRHMGLRAYSPRAPQALSPFKKPALSSLTAPETRFGRKTDQARAAVMMDIW